MVEQDGRSDSTEVQEIQEYLSQKSRFDRSVRHIEDAIAQEDHGLLRMRDIEFDEDAGIVKVHVVAVNRSAEDRDIYGAKAESGFACFNLGKTQTVALRRQFIDAKFGALAAINAKLSSSADVSPFTLNDLYNQFGVTDKQGLEAVSKRLAIEQLTIPLFAQISHVESDHHGFGGSKFALEETALNHLPVWNEDPSTHRVKLLWTYMGSESTCVSNLVGDVYDYTLEKHGVNQISRAIEETLVLIDASKAYVRGDDRKESPLLLHKTTEAMRQFFHVDRQDAHIQPSDGIESLTIKGHSMGGKVAYEMFKRQKQFLVTLQDRLAGTDPGGVPTVVRYLLDATVTEGFESNKREATLLKGLWGYVMRLGSRSLPPQLSMPIAKELKIFRMAHKDIFHVDSDDRFHRQSNWHIINAENDPKVIAQHVRTLMKTPKMNAQNETGEAFDDEMWTDLLTMVVEGSVCATLAQDDTILLVSEQQKNLQSLYIPVFISLRENHYQIRNIIGALFANGQLSDEQVHMAVEYFSGWMRGKLVQPEGSFFKIARIYERQYALYRDVVTVACLNLSDAAEMSIPRAIIESIHEELLDIDIATVMQQSTERIVDRVMALYKEKTGYRFSDEEDRRDKFLTEVYKKTTSRYATLRRKTQSMRDFFETGLSESPMEQARATALTLDWSQQVRRSLSEPDESHDVLIQQRNQLIADARRNGDRMWIPNAAFAALFSDLLHENGVQTIPFQELFPQYGQDGNVFAVHAKHPYIQALDREGLFSEQFVVTVLDDQLHMIKAALMPWMQGIYDPGELSRMFERLEDTKNLLTRSGREAFRRRAYVTLHSVAGSISQTQTYRDLVEFLSRNASPEAQTVPAGQFSKTRVMRRFSHDPTAREGVLDWYKEFAAKLQAMLDSVSP